ncbi:hypothetical protein HK100_000915 [Physocladia obscura]|uniref:Formamidase n=1 Tax=Physocladia obscura TaxID=109957 RepID=A0AAD5XGK0_9FUNG|nr:hypothetical protein HK100_000915 [Physocladia obscura]
MTIRTVCKVDISKPASEQPTPVHNRWHPNINSVATVLPGELFKVECIDWTGGQISNNDDASDIANVDLSQVHYLSGPIHVSGAEPGDLLCVEISDVQPIPGNEWGFTGIFARNNGGGFLDEHYPEAAKAIWDFEGIFAKSRHIPGVRFAGLIHPGLMGCAPSQELLETWNKREAELISTDPNRIPALANPPTLKGAWMHNASCTHSHGHDAARTVPPREHGGNCDIKNLSRGSKVYFPVYVTGAKLSMGDIHFSQGDGEISFCGAIEMAGILTLKTEIIKNGMALYGAKNPIYLPGPVEPRYNRLLTFQGISVDEAGKQFFLDATISYRMACLNAIEHLKKFGYTGYQAYLLLGAAPVEGKLAGIVDVPNACATIGLPLEIFDFDLTPVSGGPIVHNLGDCARVVGKKPSK